MEKAGKSVTPSARLNLRETVQKLILDEVIDKSGSDGWKVLVMDESTTRSVSSALTMFDIMEKNVSIVENLNKGRQPFKDMDAVYFVAPTMEAAQRIMGDFVTPERAKEIKRADGSQGVAVARYGHAHVVFTGPVDESIMRLFEDNPLLINRMKTLKEVHFDFLTAESSVFHLDQPDAMIRLFARPDTSFSTLIGRKLATLCITLNEYPNIRYQSSSTFARTIATTVYQVLTEYKKSNNSFVPYGEDASADRDRGQLIIFDRMFDPLTPLLHEFTYQAMANDLLTLDENGMIKYDTTTEKGDKIKKEAILNSEADELWVEHRHKHIAKVIDSNKQRMKDILSTNPGAAKILKDKAKGDVDMGTMASAVRNLPQYQQLMSDLGRHVTITSMCMREFSNQNLLALSAVEQTLATGIDEEGKEVKGKKAVELTISFLQSNTGLTRDQKLRLLMIFFVTQRPVSLEDRRPVIGAARLTNVDQVPLVNISNLMDSFSGDVGSLARDNSASSTASQPAKGGFFSSLFGKRVKETEKIASTAEGDYTDTRHVSGLRQVVEKAIVGQLPTERFTSVGPSLPQQSGSQGTAQSVRKFKPTDRWASKASSGHSALTGGRVIVFVAGGLTYAEMKDGADIMAKEGREVIVGGTHISNPTKYLEDIRKLEAI